MDTPQITKRGWQVSVMGEDDDMSRNEVLKKAASLKEDRQDKQCEDSFPASDPPSSNNFDTPDVEGHAHKHHRR